jgi:hypothetical protein
MSSLMLKPLGSLQYNKEEDHCKKNFAESCGIIFMMKCKLGGYHNQSFMNYHHQHHNTLHFPCH